MRADEDFAELKAEFRRRGWYGRPTLRVVFELVFHVAVFLAGLAILVFTSWLSFRALGLLLVTFGLLGVGTNTHSSAHYTTSRRRWLNEFLTYFGYPFFLQVSATYWWNKHNTRHHPFANVLEMDPDVDIAPWFAMTNQAVERGSRIHRLYYRYQWLIFPFALSLNSFGIQISGWRHLVSALWQKELRNKTHWIDLGAMLLHWVIWIVIPSCFFPVSSVIEFHVARAVTMGYALFCVLAPCHYPVEARTLTRETRGQLDFVARQTVTAVNFRTGFFGRLVCSGLDYHIEHHLFPNMCHVYYPQASSLVKQYCTAHGYPYRSYPWLVGIWNSYLNIRNPKSLSSLDELGRLTSTDEGIEEDSSQSHRQTLVTSQIAQGILSGPRRCFVPRHWRHRRT